MNKANQINPRSTKPVSLAIPTLIGAGVALVLISFFLTGVNDPKPEWGKLWMIRPLVIVPAAGALGGAVYYFLDLQRYSNNWNKTLIRIFSLIIYLFILWVGTVLGLDGTLWD